MQTKGSYCNRTRGKYCYKEALGPAGGVLSSCGGVLEPIKIILGFSKLQWYAWGKNHRQGNGGIRVGKMERR